MKKGLAALRTPLAGLGRAGGAGRPAHGDEGALQLVCDRLTTIHYLHSDIYTVDIYTVDIYTVDIYTVISTVLARPGCSSVDDGWWSYPATPHRPAAHN